MFIPSHHAAWIKKKELEKDSKKYLEICRRFEKRFKLNTTEGEEVFRIFRGIEPAKGTAQTYKYGICYFRQYKDGLHAQMTHTYFRDL